MQRQTIVRIHADDYDFMILNISDTLRLIRITMPTNKQYPEMALSVFIAMESG